MHSQNVSVEYAGRIEAAVHFTRSLAAPICLAQALVIAIVREIRPDITIEKLGAARRAKSVAPPRRNAG
jgi:hypothetical protein